MKTDSVDRTYPDDSEKAINKAEQHLRRGRASRRDRWYPLFHIASQSGWINDPNGLSYYHGRWHVYYQLNPYEPVWGPMYWGHVSSSDMVTWRRERVALAPGEGDDKDGVFSGSAVVDDNGNLCVYYTGQRWLDPNNSRAGQTQVQMMARALDSNAVHFEKLGRIIAPPQNQRMDDFRDPKVWKQDGIWYMIHGVGTAQQKGQIWLYSSRDMISWTFLKVIFEDKNPDVFMVECPDLFPLKNAKGDTVWVLCLSEMRRDPQDPDAETNVVAGYMVGDFSPETGFQSKTSLRKWDHGHNFYAPQSFMAPDGRRIMYGWMKPDSSSMPTIEDGWNGQLTIPREVRLDSKGNVCTLPVSEMAELRENELQAGSLLVQPESEITICEDLQAGEIIMEIDLETSSFHRAGLKIHATADGSYVLLTYNKETHQLVLDRSKGGNGDRSSRVVELDAEGNQLRLRVYVDRGSIEVFANQGQAVLSSYSFPNEGPRRLIMTSSGGNMVISQCQVFTLSDNGLDGE